VSGPYQNVMLSTTWGSNTQNAAPAFTSSLATGTGDINPSGFPLNTANGHVVMYMRFTATPAVTFVNTPDATFTLSGPATFGGTTCYLDSLNGTINNPNWRAVLGPVSPSANTVRFPAQALQPPNTVDVGNPGTNGTVYLSLNCN
jgi:hypothetical protein